MEILIAIGHIIGAVVAVMIIGAITLFIASWEGERSRKRAVEEASIHLGVSIEDLEKEEMAPTVIRFVSERFSSELFRNRLSDLLGIIRAAWGWLGLLVELGILVGVVWYTVTDKLDAAVYAWIIVPVSVFFWIASVAFSFMCLLLTGRYPGQAKLARKAMAEVVRNRRAVA